MKNKIAEYRKSLGLSQHRCREKVDVTRQSIMTYENDTNISYALEKKIIYDHIGEQREKVCFEYKP